ncbi:RsmB/NOP family class I SAM-dependent RNA methyltransferase [Pelagicoccus sp. SDUM812003]|uniref:RsmB/NOP family class I SAM-dependent RNA methyltransferase n=1 Tax=Pelagicoccus sp. SDUM812003 TaxID=3041267 RepID=UPI00280D6EE1|nr:RsmB/NOP family class I SAM-dependent RNA methyltransferase [Pelagicoccus sp. SDUM812003]MDQ8203021.1 RsmB/NOP family class I SAM-dependent RNA methyltransferase [Pelagicoccus sp. SDUM812003]
MKNDSWSLAVEMVSEFLRKPARLSHLMERLPPDLDRGTRRTCQSLLYGTVRHLSLLQKALGECLRKRPKPPVMACLLVASLELMQRPENKAKIVHFAVGKMGRRFGPPQKSLANAVLRKVSLRLPELLSGGADTAEDMSWRYSHPQWLVQRFLDQFGKEDAQALLRWNQREAEVFARWQGEPEPSGALDETQWSGFFRVRREGWAEVERLLQEGRLYVQNPGARIAPELLAQGFSGGRVLDLCSAPGGKSLLIDSLLGPELEEIVAFDLAGPRFEKMLENLRRYRSRRIRAVAGDVESLSPEALGTFEAVLLDTPCSNTGVLQHKVDARWRLKPEDLQALTELQLRFLKRAAPCVADGGALIYSTCSIDREENEAVVERFLESAEGRGFVIESGVVSMPWVHGHDGSGAFRMRREGPA